MTCRVPRRQGLQLAAHIERLKAERAKHMAAAEVKST